MNRHERRCEAALLRRADAEFRTGAWVVELGIKIRGFVREHFDDHGFGDAGAIRAFFGREGRPWKIPEASTRGRELLLELHRPSARERSILRKTGSP